MSSASIHSAVTARLRFEILLWRFGWACVGTLVASVIALALWCGVLASMQQQTLALQHEIAAAEHQLQRSKLTAARAPTDERTEILAVLLDPALVNAELQAIYDGAAQHQLSFAGSSVRTTDSARSSVSRTELLLPVKGTYPQIANFVEALLRSHPAISVDELRFRRELAAAGSGEAEVHVSIWSQAAVSAAPATTRIRERS